VTKRFATTRWSLVLDARAEPSSAAREALGELCATYWRPLYAFIRRQGHSPDDASDLTQAYFARLLEHRSLATVHPSKGRFRSFLLVSVRNFLADQRARDRAAKRGGGQRPISLDAEEEERSYRDLAVERLTPEDLFERRWAQAVVERALARLRDELVATDQAASADRLLGFLTEHDKSQRYREVGAELGMSEGAVKVAVHRLRRRFGRALRDEVAETVADPDQIDSELHHLLTVLQEGPQQ